MKALPPYSRATITRDANKRAAEMLFVPKGKRAQVVQDELAEASAAADANTARLRALRLEKERQDAAAADTAAATPAKDKKKPVRRVICG